MVSGTPEIISTSLGVLGKSLAEMLLMRVPETFTIRSFLATTNCQNPPIRIVQNQLVRNKLLVAHYHDSL